MRFPIVRQHDANDCGPACLAMVAAFYRRRQSIAELREASATDRQGTSLAGLVRAAEAIGFRTRAVRARPEAFGELKLPVIAHWSEGGRNHFVVVYRHRARRVTIGDPAVGARRLTREVFERHWTGTLLLLDPTPDLKTLGQSPFHTLWTLLSVHRKLFLDALAAAVTMTLLALATAFFIQVLVDFVVPSKRTATLNWLGLGMLLVLLTRAVLMALRGYLLAHLGQRIDAEVILAYHHHVLGLPLGFFAARRTGEIASRLHDAVRIRVAVGATGLSVVVDSATVVLTSAVMFWLDWQLALLSVATMPVLLLALAALTPGMRSAQQTAMERSAHFEAHTVEAIESIETLRATRAEARARLRGEVRLTEVLEAAFRSDIYSLWGSTFAALLAGGSALLLLWAGGHAVLEDRVSIGQLMALYTLFGTIVGPVERLAGANQVIQDALVASARVGDVLVLPSEQDGRGVSSDRTIEGRVEFSGVRFRYGQRRPVFENLTLEIPKGECCRISGASGSGKSTLARLLVRFYEPEGGRILIDGVDLQAYSLESLRRQVAYVSQESRLLSVSILDNLRLGRPDATFDQIRGAALEARADAFIQASPNGYASVVGERGVSLSGGERQRLVLARAILTDPAILILDEPTNHLDESSVDAVRHIIEKRRREGRTTILISHDDLPADRTVAVHA
jgi:ATP-binding cassette subfamily B protein